MESFHLQLLRMDDFLHFQVAVCLAVFAVLIFQRFPQIRIAENSAI
jgi:hypothetical protein